MPEEIFRLEEERIRKSYERRKNISSELYDVLTPDVYLRKQELERAIIKWLKWKRYNDRSNKKLLEIGCGSGFNLIKMIELGFEPSNIVGNELISERASHAKKILPKDVKIIEGNALNLTLSSDSFDIVFQSTVFSSVLEHEVRKRLANKIWEIAKCGGGILWYDFLYNNPKNKDVKGISLKEIRALFPDGKIKKWRTTLAPPISRFVTRIHPNLYHVFSYISFFRTHVLCWIEKP